VIFARVELSKLRSDLSPRLPPRPEEIPLAVLGFGKFGLELVPMLVVLLRCPAHSFETHAYARETGIMYGDNRADERAARRLGCFGAYRRPSHAREACACLGAKRAPHTRADGRLPIEATA